MPPSPDSSASFAGIRSGAPSHLMCRPDAAVTGRPQTALPAGFAALALPLMLLVISTGCAAVEGIFKAGLWVGLITAVLVIAAVVLLVRRVSR